MAKQGYAKAAISEVSYAKHLLTASARPYPTKEGALLKNKLDSHTAAEYQALLTVETSEAKNRPAIALSTAAGALQVVKGVVQEGQASGVLGPGFTWLSAALEQCGPSLALINTFGSPEALRTETSLPAAVAEFSKMLRKMNKKDQFHSWAMACLRTGTALQHLAPAAGTDLGPRRRAQVPSGGEPVCRAAVRCRTPGAAAGIQGRRQKACPPRPRGLAGARPHGALAKEAARRRSNRGGELRQHVIHPSLSLAARESGLCTGSLLQLCRLTFLKSAHEKTPKPVFGYTVFCSSFRSRLQVPALRSSSTG